MMSVFTRRVACDPDRIVECTLMLAMNVNGIGVAVSRCVTRIRSSSRETERTGGGSLVLLTAGPIRQRAATADAPRGAYSRLALRAGSPTLPPHAHLRSGRWTVSLLGGTVHRLPLCASRRSSFVKWRTAASRNGRARDALNARFTASVGGRTGHPPRQRRGCTGIDEAIDLHGRGRVEPFDRSAGPCRFSSGRPDFHDGLRAC